MSNETQPFMSTIGNRPALVLHQLTSVHGVSIQCRLADGADVWVPLSELFRLFSEEIYQQARAQEGLRQ